MQDILHNLIHSLIFVVLFITVVRYRASILRYTQKGPWIIHVFLAVSVSFALFNALLLSGFLVIDSSLWHDILDYVSLAVVAGLSIVLIYAKFTVKTVDVPKRVLAIGAHPDDLEIACGATLAKMRDCGHIIYGLILTQGEQGGAADTRAKEAQKGAGFLGLNIVDVKDFKDTRLAEQANEICLSIEEIIKRFKPDIILTHSANDQHQDHTTVFEATLRAARNNSTILSYESPSVTPSFKPTIFIDVANYLDVKLESIRQHHDQKGKRYVQKDHVRGIAAFRGGQAKVRYAEGFESVRALGSAVGDL